MAASSTPLPVRLVSTTSRVLRNGLVTFKSVSLQMPPSFVTNTIDRKLDITFTGDKPSITGTTLGVAVAITLLKCPQSSGLLNHDGGCLVEATGSKHELTAGITLAVVASVACSFVAYWSYRHSDRVLETIHAFATGIGGVVVRFAFEVIDVVSDVQAFVDLFLYDLTIAQPTLIRAAYVALFVVAVYPAVSVLRWSVFSIRAQWKRVLARKQILVAALSGPGITHRRSRWIGLVRRESALPGTEAEAEAARAAAHVPPSPRKWSLQHVLDSLRSNRKLQVHAAETVHTASTTGPSISLPQAHAYDAAAAERFLDEQEKLLLVELEYQHVRTHYMKRSLARLVSEDGLLLAFNVYIYLANRDAEAFAKSRFRASLELSIVLSVLHFGSQVQNIATWLQANKVAEIVDQLEKIRALRSPEIGKIRE